ncbi:hypothetical protein V525_05480 [Gordonia alkanivorans CGMCC 6845]|uniref:Uncharacterized protein n=1 Tax=Gordonia alkanivorans CGMCC 6845 TaxID=1423140 RepID=W9DLE3_9ACTN|nr:hypothetical protein V525_05480 [Gordonia alkanivorans CGMCC 6845]
MLGRSAAAGAGVSTGAGPGFGPPGLGAPDWGALVWGPGAGRSAGAAGAAPGFGAPDGLGPGLAD